VNTNGNEGGCGGGAGRGDNGTRSGGNSTNTNIVNGDTGISPTIQPTYVVLGNKGGDQQQDGPSQLDRSTLSCAGGGVIGAAAPNHGRGDIAAGPGGAGLNQVTINGIPYNFKSYFANGGAFGHDVSGYMG
jgi:hypothetical protein